MLSISVTSSDIQKKIMKLIDRTIKMYMRHFIRLELNLCVLNEGVV